jgi:hypothetical protein
LAILCLPPVDFALASDFTGSWQYKGPAESASWLKTEQRSQQLRFELELNRGAPSYNSGWIQGEAELHGSTALFRKTIDGKLCEITFRFSPEKVELKQGGDEFGCEFGFNVYADDTLRRISHTKPKFSTSDPRFGHD